MRHYWDTKKELFDERQCAARALEWSAERERLKAQLKKLFDEHDELRNRVVSMKKDYEELKEDNETTLAECVQLREELDRVHNGRDNERDRKWSRTQGPPSEDGKGKKAARSYLGDEDAVMLEVGNTSSNAEGDRLNPHEREIRDLQSRLPPPLGFSRTHYLYSKEVLANRRSDLQKYAVANYKLYNWVSDILDAVVANREPPSNLSAVQQYLNCSTGAITTYDPIELGRVIQYCQHSNVPGVEPLDDGRMLSKRHLRGAMLRQMVLPHNTGKSEGVDQRVPQPMKHSDWREQAAIDIYKRTRETEMPRYTIAAEDDVLLRNPTLPYPARSEYVPTHHMYEWAHPDVRGIPREEGSRIQRADSQNKCHPAKPENCMHRVYSITPFATQRRNVHEPRRIEQSLQRTSLAYNISPMHPLAPRTGHRGQESTTNATVISRAPRLSTSTQYSAPAHHRSLANRIGPDTMGNIPTMPTCVTVPCLHESPTDVPRTPRVSASVLGLQTTTMETLDAAPHTNSTNDGESLEYSNGFIDSSE
ncbi:hypothetical protein DFH07DRAFT_783939 [Mycena maculata]|uniref:Uncharacterized protein n=1 Tax=Mycena maculata TaxID=230809 RepID=A0AAD7MKW2_9AGAR|nr:hypothetical protein DFH07DRAFT_783939 [Mycena maculata]